MTARLALLLATSFGMLVSAQQAPPASQQLEIYPPNGPGIQAPALIRSVEARYTPEAIKAKVEGMVELRMVVLPDGNIRDVEVTKSLDSRYGLDQQAIDAAKQWLFRPGTKDGRAVPMFVTIVMEFRLGSGSVPSRVGPTPAVVAAADEFYKGTYPSVYPALVRPVPVRSSQPKYTSDALRAKLQGTVEVEAVVGVDGTVSRARVAKSLDTRLGLDESAVDAVKSWVFEPGRLNGQPVPVVVSLTLEFRIH